MPRTPLRQPKGIPVGGQFAPDTHAEADLRLGAGERIPGLIGLTPEVHTVLDALRAAGGRPLIVGGSVRDALLASETGDPVDSKDIDIEVHGLGADEVAAAIPGEVNLVGKSFGVFTTRINGQDFDISLPRRDSRTGDGHRDFEVELDPGITLEEAFGRRDFTINSMGWDEATGELIDPFGGRADLRDRVLRHTSEAFSDDALRVLRGVTFAGRIGMEFAPETAELCRSMAPRFKDLPKERLWKQFHGLAAKGTHISKALKALHDSGWEEHFPALAATAASPRTPSGTRRATSSPTWAWPGTRRPRSPAATASTRSRPPPWSSPRWRTTSARRTRPSSTRTAGSPPPGTTTSGSSRPGSSWRGSAPPTTTPSGSCR